MNKHILKYVAVCLAALSFTACNDSESDLLEPKVYFDSKESKIVVEDQESMDYDLSARLSNKNDADVNVSYSILDSKYVDEYNKKNGTNYEAFDPANASLSTTSATIDKGKVYAGKIKLHLTNLSVIEEGKTFLLPVRVQSSQPVIEGTDIVYIVLNKPVRILTAANINYSHIKVPVTSQPFKSLTYEALIYLERWGGGNMTVMGSEGTLILRIGDTGGGIDQDLLQIAGSKQFYTQQRLTTGKWYHVAFTYDQPTGRAVIYINGEKAAESVWDTPQFDLSRDGGGFFIGKVAGFMWGERPFYGKMSEVRMWTVARTANQIKQGMLNVDPASDGLFFYYKLNGTDQYQGDDNKWYIRDASGHGMNGLANGDKYGNTYKLGFSSLGTPIAIN